MQMTFKRMTKPAPTQDSNPEYNDSTGSFDAKIRPPLLGKPPMTGMAEPIAPRPPRNPPLGPRPVVDPTQALQNQFGVAPSGMPPGVQRLIPGQRPVEIAPPTGIQNRPMRPYMPRDRGMR